MEAIKQTEENTLLHGPLPRAIWHMVWPMLLDMSVISIGSFVDMWIAGRLGAEAQAAVGIGAQLWFLMMILTMGLELGNIAIVSRFLGAGDLKTAIEAARQGLLFAALIGLAAASFGLIICPSVFHVLGTSSAVAEYGWNYLRFAMIAIIPAALFWIAKSSFRAMGDTVTPLMVTAFDIVLTIALEFVLCFKPFHLGVSGIGIAWIVANVIALLWTLTNLKRTPLAGCLHVFDSFSLAKSKEWFVRFARIGLPGSAQESGIILGAFGVVAVLSATSEPTINQAAWSVGWRIEEVAVLFPTFAFNSAAATLIGQNLGAKNISRAENAAWSTLFGCVAVYLPLALLLWNYAPQVANFMSANLDVAKSSIGYFRLLALSAPFFAAFTVLAGAMQGAAYSRIPMLIAIFSFFVLRVGGAWLFAVVLHLDAIGAWIAMSLASIVAGILAVIAFKMGRWKHQAV